MSANETKTKPNAKNPVEHPAVDTPGNAAAAAHIEGRVKPASAGKGGDKGGVAAPESPPIFPDSLVVSKDEATNYLARETAKHVYTELERTASRWRPCHVIRCTYCIILCYDHDP